MTVVTLTHDKKLANLNKYLVKYCEQNQNTDIIGLFKNINSIFSKYNLTMPIYILDAFKDCENIIKLEKNCKKYILNNGDNIFITLGNIKYNTSNVVEEDIDDESDIVNACDIIVKDFFRIYLISNNPIYYKNELLLVDKVNDFIRKFYDSLLNKI